MTHVATDTVILVSFSQNARGDTAFLGVFLFFLINTAYESCIEQTEVKAQSIILCIRFPVLVMQNALGSTDKE